MWVFQCGETVTNIVQSSALQLDMRFFLREVDSESRPKATCVKVWLWKGRDGRGMGSERPDAVLYRCSLMLQAAIEILAFQPWCSQVLENKLVVWIGKILAELCRPLCILKMGHNLMILQCVLRNREDHSYKCYISPFTTSNAIVFNNATPMTLTMHRWQLRLHFFYSSSQI